MPSPHLLARPSGPYVRFLVPLALRPLVGSRFIVRPLGVPHGDAARLVAACMAVALSQVFEKLRKGQWVDLEKALEAARVAGPQTTTTGPGRGHTSGGHIEHSPAPLATHGLSGRRRLQSHTGLSVPLLQSPRTPVVVSPSPAMRRLFRVRDPVSPGHRATATEGPGLAEWRREGGACQMALACYAGPQGAIAWACVAAFYLARLRVGQTRGP